MTIQSPWVTEKRDQEEELNPREHNTVEENELLDLAKRRFENARSGKTDSKGQGLHQKWNDLDKMYRSDQWKQSAPDYKSQPVLNVIFSFIEAIVPRITDNHPAVQVMPRRDPSDQILAENLTDAQDYLWYVNRMGYKMSEIVRTTLKYGTTILKTVWDPDFFDGIGEVRYSVVHPMNFFPDPRAYTTEQMEYCFVRVPRSLEYLTRRWPEKGHLVQHKMAELGETEAVEGAGADVGEEQAALHEYWFRDEDGNVCVMYYAQDVVLDIIGGEYDGSDEPVYRHNKFPFERVLNYPLDKNFWGMSEIEIVEVIQRLINSFEAQIIDNTRLMSNAQWIVEKRTSGLTEEDAWLFVDRPGNIIWTDQGGVARVQGEPIPPHIPQHVVFLIEMMEQILGVHDVVQGRRPSGVRAASALIALQETANIRIRQKVRELEYALTNMVDQANWLILEHYDEPRWIRKTGRTEMTTLDVREALEKRMFDQAAAIGMAQEMTEDGMAQGPQDMDEEAMEEIFREIKFPDFDVEVHIGPSVPYSQALLYEQAKEFFQLGIVDRRAVLEATNFPGKEDILARLGEAPAGEEQMPGAGGGGERIGEATFAGVGPGTQQIPGMGGEM